MKSFKARSGGHRRQTPVLATAIVNEDDIGIVIKEFIYNPIYSSRREERGDAGVLGCWCVGGLQRNLDKIDIN